MNNSDPDRNPGRVADYFLGAALLFIVALFDWWTGPDLSFALIYLVPTTVVAWRAGRVAGVATGVASTGVWLVVELEWNRHYSHPLVPYTNFLLQLAVTLFAAILTAAVSERERDLQIEIAVRKETEAKLSDVTARKQMEELVANVSEREQQRIGQDLHDGLGQHLVSTAFATAMLRDKLAAKDLPEATDASEIAGLINSAITQSRDLARGLYPVKLEEEGLSSALEELAASVNRVFNVNCRFQCNRSAAVYDARVGSNLFRLAQEAVNNAVKHAQPRNISIRLDQRESSVTLTVSNDGRKFAKPDPKDRGMGLQIMGYRARMIGADLKIGPGADSGTLVHCTVPNVKLQIPENVIE